MSILSPDSHLNFKNVRTGGCSKWYIPTVFIFFKKAVFSWTPATEFRKSLSGFSQMDSFKFFKYFLSQFQKLVLILFFFYNVQFFRYPKLTVRHNTIFFPMTDNKS